MTETEHTTEKYPLLKEKGAVVKMDHQAIPPPDPYEISMRPMMGFLAPGVISSDRPVTIKNSRNGVIWVIDPKQGKVVDSYMPPDVAEHYKSKDRHLALATEVCDSEEERRSSFTNKIHGFFEDFMTFLKTGRTITIDYQGNTIAVSNGRLFRHGWREFPLPGGARFTRYF